jgi:hypothetical protein
MVANGNFAKFVVAVEVIGGGLITAALIWWGLVYWQVFQNTGFTLLSAAPCLVTTSDRCSLAMSLCTGNHLFGIARYSETLLWAGIVVSAVAFASRAVARRT